MWPRDKQRQPETTAFVPAGAVVVLLLAATLAVVAVAVCDRRQRRFQDVSLASARETAAPRPTTGGNTLALQVLPARAGTEPGPGPAPHVMTVQTVNERRPMIQFVHNFVTEEEADHLIALAQPRYEQSALATGNNTVSLDSQLRTSTTSHISQAEDNIVQNIEARAAALVRVPVSHVEPLQVVRYQKGQKYEAHHDYLDLTEKNANQRTVTLFVYLRTPSAPPGEACGAGTVFPNCKFEVRPSRGLAVLFHNVDEDGVEDPTTLHGGVTNLCAGTSGEKIGLNIWIRRYPFPHANSRTVSDYKKDRDGARARCTCDSALVARTGGHVRCLLP